MTDSQEMADVGAYNNYTWYQRLVQGSASRMTRYREYDLMDNDVEVARALDTIAEEMTGNNPKTDDPLDVDILTEDEDRVNSTAVLTVKAVVRKW
ncbi:portal protein [Neptunomonas sp.]|uniref:portal protein n=1 Tax=Neptunomonas sp. TaxID=1971898 RepID=UPI00356B1A13